jgi:hypothetical protein
MSSSNLINVVVLYKKCRRFRQQKSRLHQQAEIVEVKEKNVIDTSFVVVLVGTAILNSFFSIRVVEFFYCTVYKLFF